MATTAGPDITGRRFGALVALGISGRGPRGHILWRCQCDCGNQHVAPGSRLLNGGCKSCGCQRSAMIGDARRKHGYSRRSGEYKSWSGIIERCENPKNPAFGNYGGRGIQVCLRWRASFEAFLADVGPRPSRGHTIDRIDVNGNYQPGNVRWATWRTQAQNRRDVRLFSFDGRTLCLTEWARELDIPYLRLYNRIVRHGEPAEKVLAAEAATPPEQRWRDQRAGQGHRRVSGAIG